MKRILILMGLAVSLTQISCRNGHEGEKEEGTQYMGAIRSPPYLMC